MGCWWFRIKNNSFSLEFVGRNNQRALRRMISSAIHAAMPDYRRAWYPGGTYFFTVNLLQRQGNDLLTCHIELLRAVVKSVRQRHPFKIHGWVVLPEHLHCIIELPPDDANYATRWRLIKMEFSKALPRTERLSAVRTRRGERGI